MGDVTDDGAPLRRARTGASADDRGQLFLVGALSLAAAFVVLALLLNTAIFTENLSTRQAGPNVEEAVEYRDAAATGARGIVARVNWQNNSTRETLGTNFSREVSDWSALAGRQAALHGRVTNVSNRSVTFGTRITQAAHREFTNRSGEENWTVAANASGVRDFEMNVTRDSLAADCSPRCFNVEVDGDADKTWRLNVSNDSATDGIEVRVEDDDGTTGTCTVAGDHAVIDLTGGTVGGDPCPSLRFADGLEAPYDVRYRNANASNASGTYHLVVDADVSEDPHYDDAGSPFRTPAIYAATVEVTYEETAVYYRANATVAPGDGRD